MKTPRYLVIPSVHYRTFLLTILILASGLFSIIQFVFADYTPVLDSPKLPSVSNTFVWSVSGVKPDKGQEISHIELSGCWKADQIEKATAQDKNNQSLPVTVHTGGPRANKIQVEKLNDTVMPIRISTTFHTEYGSASKAATLTVKAGQEQFTTHTGGPTCNQQPTAQDVSVTTDEDIPAKITVTASDPDSLKLTFSTTQPEHGTLGTLSAPECKTENEKTTCTAKATYTPIENYYGTDSFTFTVNDGHTLNGEDASATSHPATVSIQLQSVNDAPVFTDDETNTSQTIKVGEELVAARATDIEQDEIAYSLKGGELPNGITLNLDGTFTGSASAISVGTHNVTIAATDGTGGTAQITLEIIVEKLKDQLPPDPATIAPPVDITKRAEFAEITEFLYTGNSPIQTGVVAGTIQENRVVVIRGKVSAIDGPLSGVKITVNNQPEFGQTLSREDGMFDLAVNGGGVVTINYEKQGYMPVQRSVTTPWQDYVSPPEVVMTLIDLKVTEVDLTSNQPIQIAQGNKVTDLDGTRQATLFFKQGTTAEMTLPDGTKLPLDKINVRATEYTVGPTGPKAMPADLPPTSGYTYALELSVDEAMAVGATKVNFSKPVAFYVENFIGFPVGEIVPVGYYDKAKEQWIPSNNGRVIKILSIIDGKANLDVDGTGMLALPDKLSFLGITDEELEELAKRYSAGTSLWRMQVKHFSPWDLNWPYGPAEDATKPDQPEPKNEQDEDEPDCEGGSIIECQNQILRESVDIVGTPYSLYYSSDRTNTEVASTLHINLTESTISDSLQKVLLEVKVAGRKFNYSFPASKNLRHRFVWDRKDIYGRLINGAYPIKVRIGYEYATVYRRPQSTESVIAAFAAFGISPYQVNLSRTTSNFISWQEYDTKIGSWLVDKENLGGWNISPQHAYEQKNETIYYGNGSRRSTTPLNKIITNIAGTLNLSGLIVSGSSGDGGLATNALLNTPVGLAVAADGALFIADNANNRIRKVTRDGIITRVNTGILTRPVGVAVGPDGSLFIADGSGHRIQKVSTQGTITTVAGKGTAGFSGDGGPAIAAQLRFPFGVAVGPDGSLFIADRDNNRIRKVGTDGVITTIATGLSLPSGVAVGPDGSVFIADTINNRIKQINTNGILTTIAGTNAGSGNGDGGPATAARLDRPFGIAIGRDGTIFFTEPAGSIRKIDTEGIITTIANSGQCCAQPDGGPAIATRLLVPQGIAVSPDGVIYIAESGRHTVRKIGTSPSQENLTSVVSKDGSELFIFNELGKHVRTINTSTNNVLYEFSYNNQGHLTKITDSNNNITTIERNENGEAVAIVGPYGQRTTLILNTDKYLSGITNPAQEKTDFTYKNGLLATLTDSKENVHSYSYDSGGRLIKDEDPEGGFKTIKREELNNGYLITVDTALGRTTKYQTEHLAADQTRNTVTDPAGNKTISVTGVLNTEKTTRPDGTAVETTLASDPRWGFMAPFVKQMAIRTPQGLQQTITTERTVFLSDIRNPLSLQTLTDSVTMNGRKTTYTYDASTRTITNKSAANRQSITVLDAKGREIKEEVPNIIPTQYTYDSEGRLKTISQVSATESRTIQLAYNAAGYVASITNPLEETTKFEYDLAGRMKKYISADNKETIYDYDKSSNLTSITPPGRTAHIFDYTSTNLQSEYNYPIVGTETNKITSSYNKDQQVSLITHPDGKTTRFGYDTAGRLNNITFPDEQKISYTYDTEKGNLTKITDLDGGTITGTYDGLLLKDTVINGAIKGNLGWIYDNNFRVSETSINGTNKISYSYDNDNLLTKAGDLIVQNSNQNDQLTGTVLGSLTGSFSYTEFGELKEYKETYNATELFGTQYIKDALGRIIKRIEKINDQTNTYEYIYNTAGWLTDVTKNDTKIAQYSYDTHGNRLSLTDQDSTTSATYDAQDRLTKYGNTLYSYTENGELSSKKIGDQETRYEYDVRGNLKTVLLPNGKKIEYIVDGLNRRIGKKVDGSVEKRLLYRNQASPIAEVDANGNVVSRFVYATRENIPDYIIKNGIKYRIITDHLGSPRHVVNGTTGEIVQEMDYDEFGRVTKDSSPGFQPFGFAGGLYDRDTKLTRFGARDYDAETGRWTTKEPLGFAGDNSNLYGYVVNDPVNFTDPDGLARTHQGPGNTTYRQDFGQAGNPNMHIKHAGGETIITHKGGIQRTHGSKELATLPKWLLKEYRPIIKNFVKKAGKIVGSLGLALALLDATEAFAADGNDPCSAHKASENFLKRLFGEVGGGILGTAAAGALAGSLVPGLGTAAGFAVGLAGGIIGSYAGSELAGLF